eukprot:1512468-Rhodomonas_salina.5
MTCPDKAFATSELSRYVNDPSKTHLMLSKHELAYLKGMANQGLIYSSGNSTKLVGYADATWGNDPETRRSVSGYVFLLHGAAVSWKSKLENMVALSIGKLWGGSLIYRALTYNIFLRIYTEED